MQQLCNIRGALKKTLSLHGILLIAINQHILTAVSHRFKTRVAHLLLDYSNQDFFFQIKKKANKVATHTTLTRRDWITASFGSVAGLKLPGSFLQRASYAHAYFMV